MSLAPPNFFSINIITEAPHFGFSRSRNGVLLYHGGRRATPAQRVGIPVQVNQIIEISTSGSGAAAAWTRTARTGDMFFILCKRGEGCQSSRNGPLPISLNTRGIYGVAKSTTDPYNYGGGRTAINVRVVTLLENHVSQLEINTNPITYWATPYRGNRNDALQRHPDNKNSRFAPHPQQGIEFVRMIVNNNSGQRSTIISEWPYFRNKI